METCLNNFQNIKEKFWLKEDEIKICMKCPLLVYDNEIMTCKLILDSEGESNENK